MKICLGCGARFSIEGWQCPSCGARPRTINKFHAFAPDLAPAHVGYKADYFEILAQAEVHNFWFRARNQLITWTLRRYFPLARHFFEIGCGTGYVLSSLQDSFPELILSGSEVFYEGLEYASNRLPAVEFFQMDARYIPFDGEFDVIGAFDVLEHIAEDEAVLAQMHQAARPAGGILLTVPQHQFLWSHQDEYSYHIRRYSRKELVEKVRRAGFHVIRVTSFVSLLLPLMAASRLMKKNCIGEDPLDELKIGSRLNRVLEACMSVERALIIAGLNFAAGGSLLLVAKKP